MLLRNIGGNGGLCLVSDAFFDWGVTAMRIVSKELTVEDITKKGKKAFRQAKMAILNHVRLKSDFALLCQRQQVRHQIIQQDLRQRMQQDRLQIFETDYALSTEVYRDVMEKVCNARFNEVFDNYSEINSLKGKGKLALRDMLLVGVSSKKENTNVSDDTNSDNSAGTAASAAPAANFHILLLGENGATSDKLLAKKTFVLAGLFDEVSSHKMTAEADVKKMIKSFGGTVNQRFSTKTGE